MRSLSAKRASAISMRKLGLSLSRISNELGVAKSSVSLWVRPVTLDPSAIKRLRDRPGFVAYQRDKSIKCLARRSAWQEEGRMAARSHDVLHSLACALYWAEGYKRNNKNTISMSNSDPQLLLVFAKFLRVYFNIEPVLSVKYYGANELSVDAIRAYWANIIGVANEDVRAMPIVKQSRASLGKMIGRLPYGTATITSGGTRVLQHIFGAIQEYGQFTSAEWVP